MEAGEVITAFLAAAGFAAVIGLERQAAKHEGAVSFGVRTFALYGLWGAGSGFLADEFGPAAFAIGLAGFVGLVVAAYVLAAARTGDWGTTTEAAALAAFLTGALAWSQLYLAALAVSIGTAAVLRSKEFLHALTARFSDDDVQALIQFAVITGLVLPLVPNEEFGPFQAFNPREIWMMVVIISAVGLVGYVAMRLLGSRGLVLTGYLGGLVSSTAVTLGYSRMARSEPRLLPGLAAGIFGASVLMYPRVLVEAYVIAPDMASKLALPLSLLLIVVTVIGARYWFRQREPSTGRLDLGFRNPLGLGVALQFGLLYAAIVFVSKVLLQNFSEGSIQIVGAMSGLNDVDAITLSTADLVRDGLDPVLGARAVLLAVSVNTMVKAMIALALGGYALGRAVGSALVPAALVGLGAWLLL